MKIKGTPSPPQELHNRLLDHYNNGRFKEAEKLAISIIQDFPKYKYAWFILGLVLRATGRKSEAVDANQVVVELSPQDAATHSNLGVTLEEMGRLDEAEASFNQAITLNPNLAAAHNSLGNTLKKLRRFDEAEASYNQAIELKSDYVEAHYNLGNILKELGRLDEAKASYAQAIVLSPDLVEAHYNLGNTLKELGKFDEAETSYNQAIELRSDHAEAHNNLGVMFQELGRLNEAVTSYSRAIALKPDFAETLSNLGSALQELGRLDEAVTSYSRAIALKSDFAEAYVNLGVVIKNIRFKSSNPKLYAPLTQLLTYGNFTRPKDVAKSILSLLKKDDQINNLLLKKNYVMSLNEATSIIRSLDKLLLLHHLMRTCPLPELQLEKLFIVMRSVLLKNLDKMEVSPELIYFLSTLSIHCFTNDYVYIESDEETHLVTELEDEISRTLAKLEQPEAIKILCLASYRALHKYDWCQKLESLDKLEAVKKRLIEEPLIEKKIARDIPLLKEISDDMSLKVREQYEESPYPRWVKLRKELKAKSITEVCNDMNIRLYSKNIKNITAPTILIAGCGTGQHSIETASRFSNCHVTAVDLSLSSLAYAQRKSNELHFTNIDYFQADILHLHKVDKEFDIIESSGVLHHMDEPMAGWRVLVDLLKPGGLMRIGLYSELARQHILEIREKVKVLKVGTSETDIREFRQSLVESHDENHLRLTTSNDFYSLSTLRDLIFHVQEHHFTLPQIKNCFDELGIKFCGFENVDAITNFRDFHGNEADIYDLEMWYDFERRNPQAFSNMYQFWCQKS